MPDKKLRIRRTRIHLGEVLKRSYRKGRLFPELSPHQTKLNVLSDISSIVGLYMYFEE